MPRRRRLPLARAPRVATLAAALALAVAGALAGAPAPAPPRSRRACRSRSPADDGSLTPYTFESGYAFMSLVYDTLTWRDAHGVAQPWLARSVRRSPTGRRFTVRLRGNIRWQDGRPLTAADVVFTYRYMMRRPHPRFTPELRTSCGSARSTR